MLKKFEKYFFLPWKAVNRAVEWAKFCESLHIVLTIFIFCMVIGGTYHMFAPITSIARGICMLVVAFFAIGALTTLLSMLGSVITDVLLSATAFLSSMYDRCDVNTIQKNKIRTQKNGLVESESPRVNLDYFIKKQEQDPYQIVFLN